MCLYVKSDDPDDLKWKNGRLKVYKVVARNDKKLTAPYMSSTYRIGYNNAKGRISCSDIIHEGAIHVSLTLERAKDHCSYNEVIIPITVYKKDFIAIGEYADAAFKRIYISQKMYRKALNSKKKVVK